MPAPRKILVRGVNWLGDAVMTTPGLQRLREARPHDSIVLLTDGKLADLWKGHPAINDTISFSREENIFTVARRLREHRFDIALVLPNSLRSALECRLARVPIRIGYGGNGRGWLLTERIPHRAEEVRMRKRSAAEVQNLVDQPRTGPSIPPKAHQVYNYLHLVQSLGASPEPVHPHIRVTSEEMASFAQKFRLPTSTTFFGLNAGAEYGPAKRWPAENFIRAAIEIRRVTECSWLVFGGPNDRELAARIAGEVVAACGPQAAVSIAGQTTLRELCVGLAYCSVVLTNDSGPMHLAAAVGSRVVVPFGSTSPELTAPGLPGDSQHTILRSGAPCSPCFRRECPIDLRCLTGIEVAQVVAAVLKAHSGVVAR